MEKTFDVITIDNQFAVVVDKEAKCPKGTWTLFANTTNGEVRDFIGCKPMIAPYDYAANGIYNFHIIASFDKRIGDLPLIELVDEATTEAYKHCEQNFGLRYEGFTAGYKAAQSKYKYSEEDMKQFGIYLGNNLKKLKGGLIDDIFNSSPFNKPKYPKSVVLETELEFNDPKYGWTKGIVLSDLPTREVLQITNPQTNTIIPISLNY